MICTNLCKLIDGIDIKPAFAVVFDLKPCPFFLNTGKMFSIQTGINDPTEMKKKYGFFFENYTANKTNCKVVSLKIRKPYAKIIRVGDYDEENGRMPRRKQFSLFEVMVIGD